MALARMESGSDFLKIKSKRWRKNRHIELSRDHLVLQVSHQSCGGKKSTPSIFLDIYRVVHYS